MSKEKAKKNTEKKKSKLLRTILVIMTIIKFTNEEGNDSPKKIQ